MFKFKNTFKYNHKTPFDFFPFSNGKIINLSNLLYVNEADVLPVQFNFNSIVNIKKAFVIKKEKKEYKILVHPEIENLAKAFKQYDLCTKTIKKPFNKKDVLEKYKEMFQILINELICFLSKRFDVLANGNFRYLNLYTVYNNTIDCAPLEEILNFYMQTMTTQTLIFNDYRSYFSKKREQYEVVVNKIHNYKTLKEKLEEFINSDSDYYVPQEKISKLKIDIKSLENSLNCSNSKHLRLKKTLEYMYEIMDHINNNPIFNKDYLTEFCKLLETYIEKETALDQFCYKILNKEI